MRVLKFLCYLFQLGECQTYTEEMYVGIRVSRDLAHYWYPYLDNKQLFTKGEIYTYSEKDLQDSLSFVNRRALVVDVEHEWFIDKVYSDWLASSYENKYLDAPNPPSMLLKHFKEKVAPTVYWRYEQDNPYYMSFKWYKVRFKWRYEEVPSLGHNFPYDQISLRAKVIQKVYEVVPADTLILKRIGFKMRKE